MKNKFDTNTTTSKGGVYWFKDKKENILYIGKAKNIKKRINQYLNGSINSYKTPILLKKAESFDYQVCANEKEALILEQELIKKHKPYYNVLFLDDKKYPYIVIELKSNTIEFKTRFFYKQQKNTFYFGPLPPNYGYKTIKNFLIRECLYENGLLIPKKNDPEFWKEKFDHAKKILSSSNRDIINRLKQQMIFASENEQYELAKDFRDVIQSLTTNQQQSIVFESDKDFDVIAIKEEQNNLMVNVHNFKNGTFFMQEEFVFEIYIDIYETIRNFINSFYSMRNAPDFIITNYKIDQDDLLVDKKIVVPKKGKYFKSLQNALNNIEINKQVKLLSHQKKSEINLKVKNFLSSLTNNEINDFLMIDNSNENNEDVVSVIIYYKNYLPHYLNYRKYHLKTINQKSDIEYIKQGLTLYFENQEEVPDLIIVDGSKQQLNVAKEVVKKFNLNLSVIGLVKDKNHQTDSLLANNQKIKIKDKTIFTFFSKIQYEVDRFAKNFHSKKKITSSLEGFLNSIKGIGEKTEKKLLNHFKTYTNIYNASEEELSKIVSKTIASKIKKNLKK